MTKFRHRTKKFERTVQTLDANIKQTLYFIRNELVVSDFYHRSFCFLTYKTKITVQPQLFELFPILIISERVERNVSDQVFVQV